MHPSRRDVLRGGVVLGAAAAGGPLFYPSRHAVAATPIRVAGTTLERTILRNDATANAGGYRLLVAGAGEPHILRTDLKVPALPGRAARRTGVLAFAHLTDIHVIDAQSPARVEFTDRYNDAPTSSLIFEKAYRPQEVLTTQLADAIIRGARGVRSGPVTGRPLEFAICTGDSIDNAQYNELRQYIALLDGSVVTPDSGDPAKWEGVHDGDPTTYDVHYWHPDGTPPGVPGGTDDNARRLYGFPTVPGALTAAGRSFRATGIGMPWFTAFGNHEPLAQGNVTPNAVINAIAVGGTKVVGLPAGVSAGDVEQGISRGDPGTLAALLGGPGRPVTPDPNRRMLSRAEIIAEHFVTSGTPVGHGYSRDDLAANRAYYAFDHGPLRCVVLDTVNPGGQPAGSIDRTQLTWLQGELTANSRAKGGPRDRLIVVFSHHTIATMTNELVAPGETQRRVLGPEVAATLLDFPNVILWVNGHTHRNSVTPRLRTTGGGFWEVNTAAHVDFPCQSRVVELVDNHDGTLSIFTTIVDADAPLSFSGRIDSPRSLAALARELAANDWQARGDVRRGPIDARNVELIVAAPFSLVPVPPVRRGEDLPAPRPLPATGPEHRTEVLAAALAVAAAGLAAAARREQSGDLTDVGR
ncbi:MAG TPA: TIGR03767 family metallophosphoesterase [Mycobacteriales bacterium]|nr:TIGR03767 family metallophosphoesterase [Mycobacteriales bacterium]